MAQGDLPPELLRILMLRSEERSDSQAREQINFSPLIERVQKLVRGPLFSTTPDGINLTELGELVLALARQAVALNEAVLQAAVASQKSEHIRLGMNSMLFDCFVSAPSCSEIDNLLVNSDRCPAIMKAFNQRELDIAMVLDVKDHRSNLESSLVAEFEIDFAWIKTTKFVFDPDAPIPLAVWPADEFIFLNALSKAGRPYRVDYTSPDYFAKFSAVKSGKCLAVVPRKAVVFPFVEAREHNLPAIEPKKVLVGVHGDPTSSRFKSIISALSSLDLVSSRDR